MPGALGLALVLLAMAGLALTHGESPVAGLQPREIACLAGFGVAALVVAGAVVDQFRGRWLDGFRALAVWALIIVGLVGAYGYRDEVREVGARIVGELAPEAPVASAGGEVRITRRLDGSFVVGAKIADRDVRLIFDTGASTVVLTAESAAALGIRPRPAEFVVPVMTANGASLTAPVVLDKLSIGSITERRVRALVAKPGALHQNLLGMTFLDRLASYEVRSNRLILRPKTS